jgi:hypothetical protein
MRKNEFPFGITPNLRGSYYFIASRLSVIS